MDSLLHSLTPKLTDLVLTLKNQVHPVCLEAGVGGGEFSKMPSTNIENILF